MHFNIYINDHLGSQLISTAEKQGITRNRLICKALQEFVKKENSEWPDIIMQFQGIPDFPAFEESRGELLPAQEDPFEWTTPIR